ncbi:efflux RND transporter permease subunit [Methyloceanibacter sp.]|uniref:efflux RND transporter permease subunit n=1 Tax=Methyloceanibacter sp. TaxID=1965321 RepID=UPI003D6CADF0
MRSIVEWSLRTKSLVLGVALLVFVFGLLKLRDVTVDALPEFSTPYVEIQTEALGLSAEEAEGMLTVGLEADLLNGVPWLQSIQSQTIDGLSSIRLNFEPGTDLMAARQMVQERLTQAKALPNVSLPPVMLPPLSSTSKVMAIGLMSDKLSTVQLSILARWTISPRLMGVPGVANVSIWGLRDRELQVRVNPQQLNIQGVALEEVVNSAGEALWESPLSYLEASTPGTGGWIDTPNQRLGVRHVLPIVTASDLSKVTFQDKAGNMRKLGDVADVVEGHQPLIGDAIINGRPGLLLVVDKFPWGNTLDVTRGVDAALASLKPGLPGVEVDTHVFRPATFIQTALTNLSWTLLAGGVLMIALLFALLYEWRVAVISLVAISLSFVATLLVLYLLGTTMNVMVLAGLVIALAAIVDDAIIDVGKIAQYLRERRASGDVRATASIILEASLEARTPIIYATLIGLLAIMPFLVMGGLAGLFFKPLVLAYSVALLASLVVALTVTAVLSSMLLDQPQERRRSRLADWLGARQEAAVRSSMNRQGLVYGALGIVTVLAIVAAWPLLSRSALPEFKERDVLIDWSTRPGTSLEEMNRITSRASDELRAIPGVIKVSSSLGRAVTSRTIPGPYEGQLWISLDPNADYAQTVAQVRDVTKGYVGVVQNHQTYLQGSVSNKLVEPSDRMTVRVFGAEEPVIREKALEIANALKGQPGVTAAVVAPRVEAPAIEIETDLAKAEQHGLRPGDVRRAASTLLGRILVGSLFQDQKVFSVVVWGKPDIRQSLTDVSELLIDAPDGSSVRLGDVASVRIKPAELVINRDAVSRYVDVNVTVDDRNLRSVRSEIENAIQQVKMPEEYHAEMVEEGGGWVGGKWRLLGPIIAAAALILLFLQAALSSWRLAFLVFATLPAALAGGILVAALGGSVMSFAALMGLLAVFTFSVRNDIALIRHAQSLAAREPTEAKGTLMLRGARDLALPIAASALVTAAALLPFALAGNVAGLELLHSLAAVILGGLVSATLFTLLVLPAICASINYSAEPDPLPE